MENLFYYTGVTVWVLIALVTIYVLIRLCAIVVRKHILPTLSNIRIGLFGKKDWDGRCYQLWLKFYAGRYGLQRHNHKWSHLRRFAYRRFLINAWEERKLKSSNI